MNKDDAAKALGISVRSLQRLAEKRVLTVIQKRGESGKLQTFFDAEDIANYKRQRDTETVKPATATMNDTALARNDTHQFLELIRSAITPEQKKPLVGIADKPLLKLDEAAALTGLSRDTLREAIETEELTGKKIGRAFRIKRADLDKFIENL
jgi:excisionase family DNA binding protein